MIELKTAINIVEFVVAFVAVLLLGDYLGYKIGRWRLAYGSAIVALVIIVLFAVFAAVWLK